MIIKNDTTNNILEFFECENINEINSILVCLCDTHNYPEWLRNVKSITELPNYNKTNQKHYFRITNIISENHLANMIFWIVENIKHDWSMDNFGFSFSNKSDLASFYLIWK